MAPVNCTEGSRIKERRQKERKMKTGNCQRWALSSLKPELKFCWVFVVLLGEMKDPMIIEV